MNALDIALIVVLSYFLIRGIFRGLVKEVVGFLGIFIAFWVASIYWPNGAGLMKGLINNESFQAVLSFIAIYLVTYTLIGIFSVFVDKIVKLAITPLVSSLFGALIGLVKGIALTVVILSCSTAFIGPGEPFFRDSAAWSWFEPMTVELKSFLPRDLGQLLGWQKNAVSGRLGNPLPQLAPSLAADPHKLPIAPPVDYKGLLRIADAFPGQIKSGWKERLQNLTPDAVGADPAIISGFVHDHPNLFKAPDWSPGDLPRD
ncbi:MAG: CvpA family protein [Deltaproteobacteria bacterium]|jgi:membrane protein required for colicin V production|nr:CvpA family protein [Deltaproteobacteria bacterium]